MINLGVLCQYARIIGRIVCTPVIALLYEAGFSATCVHILDPIHALLVQTIIYTHYIALVIYDSQTNPQHHDAPTVAGTSSYVEFAVHMLYGASFFMLVGFLYGYQMERMRRSDSELRAHALALRSSTERIVRNFLPAAVVKAVNQRSSTDGANVGDIVAWSFDPGCLMQSDIVGFTALGSRISPEDLCGCGLALPLLAHRCDSMPLTSFLFFFTPSIPRPLRMRFCLLYGTPVRSFFLSLPLYPAPSCSHVDHPVSPF